MQLSDASDVLKQLTGELENFEDMAKYLLPQPGEIPRLQGIDVFGGTLALKGVVGGDHIIYVDFKQRFDLQARITHAAERGRLAVVENLKRCQRMAGIAVIDVSGHQVTDTLLAAMPHQAFLLGAIYELDMFGCVSFPPLGMLPSLGVIDRSTTNSILGFKDQYEMNEWSLMSAGDILLLHTDGLGEHTREHEFYVPSRLAQKLREFKDQGAGEIFEAVKEDLLAFNNPSDDISLVVVKRT